MRPFVLSTVSLDMIFCFNVGEISSVSGLYTLGSFRCNICIALVLYLSWSSTTMVEPLSALFITICGLWVNSLRASLVCFVCICISILILCIGGYLVHRCLIVFLGLCYVEILFMNGSLFCLWLWVCLLVLNVLSSYTVFILCMKFLISLCKVCI